MKKDSYKGIAELLPPGNLPQCQVGYGVDDHVGFEGEVIELVTAGHA